MALGMIAIYLAQLAFNGIGRSHAARELAAKVNSTAELSQVAHAYINDPNLFPPLNVLSEGPTGVLQPLRHRNPQFRYAGAIHPDVSLRRLVRAVLSERCALVRHEMARRICMHPEFSKIASEDLDRLKRRPMEDIAYMMEEGSFSDFYINHRQLWLFDQLKGGLDWVDAAIAKGFDRGIETILNQRLDPPNRKLRDIVRALSPLETGGLGTFDELRGLTGIDNVYLFLRQVLFYDERELFAPPEDAPATANRAEPRP